MAIVYEKIPDVDQCVILDNREAVLYPFDLGDWSEIRIGVMMSLIGNSSDNVIGVIEDIGSNPVPQDKAYFGIKSSGQSYPLQDDICFVGIAGALNGNVSVGAFGIEQVYNSVLSGTDGMQTTFGANSRMRLEVSSSVTGESTYSQYFSLKVNRSGNFYSGAWDSQSNGSFTHSDVSTNYLRGLIRQGDYIFPSTGSMPSGGMNNIFLYLPFLNNRVRVHNLIVERFK